MKNSDKKKAVCLVSGGMDSAVCLAIALMDHDVAIMHAYYGQLTQDREVKAFRDLGDHFNIDDKMIISLSHLTEIGGSSLTDPAIEVPTDGLSEDTPNTYVPFRNAHLLAAAISWAEVIGAGKVFIGAVEEDSSGYPDCRQEFFDAFNVVSERGTLDGTHIEIVTPVIHSTKAEIVKKGMELKVPFELTWSCYQNSDIACGVCDSCILRLNAFENAGYIDPIPYEVNR